MSKRVAVTGGKGFIGSHLVVSLKEKGWDVCVVDMPEYDIRDLKALTKAFTGVEYVFHLAALPQVQYSIESPIDTHEVNVGGTLNVLLAARDTGVKRVIFSASSAAYGDQEVAPLAEHMPALPKSPYALHKYMGEHLHRLFYELHDLETVSLRYFNVYGPGARAQGAYAPVVALFLQKRAAGEVITITGDGEQTRDFVHVYDVVRANILAAESDSVGKGEVLNIGTGKSLSVNQIAALVGGPVEFGPPRVEPRNSLADISRAKKLLGWEPTISLEEGIEELKKLHNLV